MAAEAGTGVPGANQDGPVPAPVYSPGEVVTAAGPLTINAPAPKVDLSVGSQFVTTAYNLVVYPSLRPQLILDQFATVRATRLTHRGSSVRFSFVDDLAEATTPLLENIDVDSAAMEARGLVVPMQEYGNAVTTTALLRGTSMVPIDPMVAERVGYNAGASIDTLAGTALQDGNVTYDDGTTGTVETVDDPDGLSSAGLREAVLILQQNNARPLRGSYWTLIASPAQIMALRGEAMSTSNQAGWRDVTMREEGMAGNNIFYGQVGTYEGVNIIANNHMPDPNKAVLMGAESFAKVYSNAAGFGATPNTVVSPVVDKLRRFASVGWHHLVGYSVFRTDSLVYIDTTATP